MSQNYYKLYTNSIIELASTIIIKSEYTAIAINNRINELYGIVADPTNKASWKYYLNISGQYHSTDTVIEITSLDDLTKITFDSATLANHPATREAYKFGTRYYRELVNLYPDMQQFIVACIYPANINKAIEAQDGEILSYPEHLIEEQEESLISNIQNWLYGYKVRWYNKQFNESDNLYSATNLGIMYLNLVPLIFNLRLKACKTNEVHSFHIRNYLASHGYLDKFIDFLNLKQKLFLYRNIAYIERNNGRVEIFKWLVEKLLSDRNLPIAEYSMRHDTSTLLQSYYSKPVFRRKDLTDVYSSGITKEIVIELDELLRRENPLAIGNNDFIFDYRDQIYDRFKHSTSSVVGTKDLESSVVDYTDSEAYTLAEIRTSHWLKKSTDGSYSAFITFKDPVTSEEKSLSAFDAFVYWYYCFCSSLGITLIDIPTLFAYKTIRNPKPTLSQLKALVNSNKVSDTEINQLLNTIPNQGAYNSVQSFSVLIENIYSAYKKQQILLSSEQTMFKRGMLEAVSDNLYKNEIIDTVATIESKDGEAINNFPLWFASKGISVTGFTREMFESLHLEIFKNATGGDFYTTKELGALQKAMVDLLKQLSSYSIQILTEINARNIRKLGWHSVRPDNLKNIENAKHDVLAITTYVNTATTTESSKYNIEPIPIVIKAATSSSITAQEQISIPVKVNESNTMTIKKHVIRLGTITVNHTFVNPTDPGAIKHLSIYDSFFALTPEERRTVKDLYYDVFKTDESIGKINTSLAIMRNYLPGFSNLNIVKPILKSFEYTLIPAESYRKIRLAVNASLEAILPNIGKIDVNAYALFASNTILNTFRYYAGKTELEALQLMAGSITAHPQYLQDKMEFGHQLGSFVYTGEHYSFNGFNFINEDRTLPDMVYTASYSDIDFIKGIMNKSAVHHPTQPGGLYDAFNLVSSGNGQGYIITGYTYNGYQIIWS